MAFDFKQIFSAQVGWGGIISALSDMILTTGGGVTISGSVLPLVCGQNQVMSFGSNAYTRGAYRIRLKTPPASVAALAKVTKAVVTGAAYPAGIGQSTGTDPAFNSSGPGAGAAPSTLQAQLALELATGTTFPTNQANVVKVPMISWGSAPGELFIADEFQVEGATTAGAGGAVGFQLARVVNLGGQLSAGTVFDIEVTAVP